MWGLGLPTCDVLNARILIGSGGFKGGGGGGAPLLTSEFFSVSGRVRMKQVQFIMCVCDEKRQDSGGPVVRAALGIVFYRPIPYRYVALA